MSKYFVRITLTPQAVATLQQDKASGRRATVAKMIEAAGGKLEAYYFGLAVDEVLALADLPDPRIATPIAMAVNGAGVAQLGITPLLTPEEVDEALPRVAAIRPPGR
jgi:uncharacterized protein with GYD domain